MRKNYYLTLIFLLTCSVVSAQDYNNIFEGISNDPVTRDRLGSSVSISGSFAVAGAPQDGFGAEGSGFAIIYKRDINGNWNFHQRIEPSDGEGLPDKFGSSVSMSGDYLLVGAPGADGNGSINTDLGAAYLFKKNASDTWQEVQKIIGEDGYDFSGTSVCINGENAIIGNPGGGAGLNPEIGSATIYKLNGVGTLDEVETLVPLDLSGQNFGGAVAIDENIAVVGAPTYHIPGENNDNNGCAYLFTKLGSSWNDGERITSVEPGWDQYYGDAVSVSGNTAFIRGNRQSGKVDVYEYGSASWIKTQTLSSPENSSTESVAVSGNFAVIGQIGNDGGSASIYQKNSGNWQLLQTVDPDIDGGSFFFGSGVAVQNGRVVVGDALHSFDLNNEEKFQAGIMYIFESSLINNFSESPDNLSLNIYPNPASNELAVDISTTHDMTVSAIVYDLQGKKTGLTLPNQQVNGTLNSKIDVSTLKAGQYIIYFSNNGKQLGATRFQKVD